MIYRILLLDKATGHRRVGVIEVGVGGFLVAEQAGKDWAAQFDHYDFVDCVGLSPIDTRSKVVEVT